jgi:F-type H+-transporting ATPase subunit gamma
MVQLLPIKPATDTRGITGSQFIFEPEPEEVLNELLPRYLGTRLYQAALEEHGQLLLQPDGGDEERHRKRGRAIEDYTLSYNKARQANITRELIEIASGAR